MQESGSRKKAIDATIPTVSTAALGSSSAVQGKGTPVEQALKTVTYREGMSRGAIRLLHLRDDINSLRAFYPIAGKHEEIVDFVDLVEEEKPKGSYPILVLNFDPHHDAYPTSGEGVHEGNWKTYLEERGSAIVATLPVAEGVRTMGGLAGSDGRIIPPRASSEPVDSRFLSAQDYAQIAELKDMVVTLPDGSQCNIQNYPGDDLGQHRF